MCRYISGAARPRAAGDPRRGPAELAAACQCVRKVTGVSPSRWQRRPGKVRGRDGERPTSRAARGPGAPPASTAGEDHARCGASDVRTRLGLGRLSTPRRSGTVERGGRVAGGRPRRSDRAADLARRRADPGERALAARGRRASHTRRPCSISRSEKSPHSGGRHDPAEVVLDLHRIGLGGELQPRREPRDVRVDGQTRLVEPDRTHARCRSCARPRAA